jgi:PPOX class probable F420-dependent enzyme
MAVDPLLSARQRTFLEASRRAILATIAPDGRPRPVPICFILSRERPILYTPIDDKPKQSDDPLALARVRDIKADPRVTVLVDQWDEDWTRLAWLRAEGRASVLDAAVGSEHANAVEALRVKYPQYETHRLEHRPLIQVTLERVTVWGLDPA